MHLFLFKSYKNEESNNIASHCDDYNVKYYDLCDVTLINLILPWIEERAEEEEWCGFDRAFQGYQHLRHKYLSAH